MINQIRDLLQPSMEANADVVALRWPVKKETEECTYGKLWKNVTLVRSALLRRNLGGFRIAMTGAASDSWITAFLSVVTGPMTAVPLDVNLPLQEKIELLQRSHAAFLFLGRELAGDAEAILSACRELKEIVILDGEPAPDHGGKTVGDLVQEETGKELFDGVPEEEGIAVLLYTSGTTGKSKGVLLSQKNLSENCRYTKVHCHPGLVLLSVLPVHHAFCLVLDYLKALSLGATVVINDSLLHLLKNMKRFSPEIMLMVPLMLETIGKKLSSVDPALPAEAVKAEVFGPNLRVIYSGGAHLNPAYVTLFKRFGVDVLEGYGMSECSPVISQNTEEEHRTGSVGKPLENAKVRIENGEILVQGTSVMKGYDEMEEETRETLRGGWLHTGDLGYLDEEGYLYLTGRCKNLIILSNGENVSPEGIEAELSKNPLIGEVVVSGEDGALTARIYPDPDVANAMGLSGDAVSSKLQELVDAFNESQPSWRHLNRLVVRHYPFLKNTTQKILRAKAELDIPPEEA
ncbi:MAG: AMP-binding protein [Bilifractor sp.]|jgi:long-subunit acyl-CoA synthetase (AMP-forming)